MDLEREQNVEELRRAALALEAANRHLVEALRRKCKELAALKGSENELQQTLALVEELTRRSQAKVPPPREPTRRHERVPRTANGPTDQPHLAHVEETYELDDADRTCPSCGGELRPMDGQFETSEMIDVVEVSYRVVQVQQQKYVCRCGSCVETAPGPDRAIAGGRYSLRFAAKVAIDKYLDHLPLARQERILERHGLTVTSQTLWDQANALARRLRLVDDALLAHVLAQPVIGLDQTSWPRLDGVRDKPWQMWCMTAPGLVVHRIRGDKSAATFTSLVGNYRGVVVCDALGTHAAGARASPGIVLAGCWAHVYRKFEEALPGHPEAEHALAAIGALYDVDREAGTDPERRAQLRRAHSTDVINELKDWLWQQATLKTLSIGKAAAYTIANWDRLVRFLLDPKIPLDNNATERGIRGPVVGRKNHYGSRSRAGTQVAATMYSILETAKLYDLDVTQYVVDAARAADAGHALMPWDVAR